MHSHEHAYCLLTLPWYTCIKLMPCFWSMIWFVCCYVDAYVLLPWFVAALFEMNGMIGFHMLGFLYAYGLGSLLSKGRYVCVLGWMMPWLYA